MNAYPLQKAVGLLLALLCAPVCAEVYRCERDGHPVFTDQPCGDGAPAALPPLVVVPPEDDALAREHDARVESGRRARDAADARWLEAHKARRDAEERVRRARANGGVTAGMTPADVRFAWGEPERVLKGENGERWRYRLNRDTTATVVFHNGVVSDVQARTRKRR